MKKVCMIVLNNVIRDPRVMKESASLAEAGYQVSIIGIADNSRRGLFTRLRNGTEIHRYRYKRWRSRAKTPILGRMMLFVAAIICFAAVVIAGWLQDSLLGLLKVLLTIFVFLAIFVFSGAFWLAWKKSKIKWNKHDIGRRISKFFGISLRHRKFEQFARMKLSEIAPDVVHCHDLLTLPIGVAYVRKHPSVKCIYDSHEIFEEQSQVDGRQRRTYQRMQRKLSPYVDGFITVNDSIASFLRQRYPKLPEATVIMNAIEFDGEEISYDGCLHRAAGLPGLPRETKILLFHGGFANFRGLTFLVSAGHHLPRNWAIVLMGDGSLEKDLREIVSTEHLSNVRFVRPVSREDLPYWVAGATVGIIPYENVCLNHWYCSPNKLWEYPAAGVPVLANSLEVMETIIQENGIGWTQPDLATPHVIARTVASLTEEELEQKRQNCRRFIERDNWSVYEKRLLGLYEKMTGASSIAQG